jgi:hypothetical protein
MRELYGQRTVSLGTRSGSAVTVIAPNAPAVPGTGAGVSAVGVATATPRRLTVIALPARGKPDSTLTALQRHAAVELADRANRGGGQWAAVSIDTLSSPGRGFPGQGTADFGAPGAFAYLTMQRDSGDSVKLSVVVRNADPGTNFGYRALTSDAVYRPTTTAPFSGTLNDAARLLRQLRQLPTGQVWLQDMGRSGRGGPYDPGAMVRSFNPKQFDSLRKIGESLSRLRPPARRRDSLPLQD